jgi:hypothetical protein
MSLYNQVVKRALPLVAFLAAACAQAGGPQTPLEKAGIPLYPKAVKVSINMGKQAKNGSHTVYAEYSSKDPYDRVIGFYVQKLQLQEMRLPGVAVQDVSGKPKMEQLMGKIPSGGFLQMYVGPNGPNKTKIQYYFILMPKK